MRSLFCSFALLAATAAFAQIGEGPSQQTLNVVIGEPQRNCPSVTFRVIVSNVQGQRITGLTPENFSFSEGQLPTEASISEVSPGEYAFTFNSTSTGLRMSLNVSVRSERFSGFANRLTTSCALRVSCGDLPVATVGVPYKASVQYAVPDGFFNPVLSIIPSPTFLKIDPITGELTGTFATPGNFDFFAVITINSSADGSYSAQSSCQIRINLPPITFTDYTPKSATQCSPGFPVTVTGGGFQPQQTANSGTFLVFDGQLVPNGTLNGARTELTSIVSDTLVRTFKSPINVGISTRAGSIQPIDSALRTFSMRRPPNFAANFTQTTLQAAAGATVTPLNVDVLDLDATTGLRFTVGASGVFLKPRLVVGGRLVFDVPNDLIGLGGTATISLVNGDEANPQGIAYAASCAPNSSRTLTLGPARPAISGLSPRTATACAPAFPLTINGSNFGSGSTVEWEGSALPNPQVAASSISVGVSADRLGTRARTVPVTVTSAGVTSIAQNFSVNAAPALRPLASSILPIAPAADQTVTATGTDFVNGVTRVRWARAGAASVLLATAVQSPTQLSFTVPRALLATAGAIELTAVNADEANPEAVLGTAGGSCPSSVTVNVANPAASVRTLDPSSEIASRPSALDVTVNGAGFLEGARVLVNGTAQDARFVSSSQLVTSLTPAQLANAGTLRIAVQNPNAAASNTSDFTVSAVPVPRFTITANPAAPAAVQDIALSVAQSEAPARQLRATLSLTFEANADNLPATGLPASAGPVFAAGGTTFTFDVTGTGGALPSGALVRPGTVAGTVIIRMTALTVAGSTASVLPSPAPEIRVVVPRTAPVIDSARILPTSTGFDVEILAFSPVRNVTNAVVQVNVVTGTRVESETRFTVDLTSLLNTWYRDAANLQYGSQFRARLPFTLQNGDANVIDSVSVTLTNSIGTSAPVTGRR